MTLFSGRGMGMNITAQQCGVDLEHRVARVEGREEVLELDRLLAVLLAVPVAHLLHLRAAVELLASSLLGSAQVRAYDDRA